MRRPERYEWVFGAAIVAVVVVFLVVVFWPEGPKLDHGEVIARVLDPAHEETECTNTVSGDGKTVGVSCHDEWVPERYRLRVTGPHPDDDAKALTQWVWVDSATFADCATGDQWKRGEGCTHVPS